MNFNEKNPKKNNHQYNPNVKYYIQDVIQIMTELFGPVIAAMISHRDILAEYRLGTNPYDAAIYLQSTATFRYKYRKYRYKLNNARIDKNSW